MKRPAEPEYEQPPTPTDEVSGKKVEATLKAYQVAVELAGDFHARHNLWAYAYNDEAARQQNGELQKALKTMTDVLYRNGLAAELMDDHGLPIRKPQYLPEQYRDMVVISPKDYRDLLRYREAMKLVKRHRRDPELGRLVADQHLNDYAKSRVERLVEEIRQLRWLLEGGLTGRVNQG